MAEKAVKDLDALLRGVGLRRTPVRVGVLKVLSESSSPLDAPAILARFAEYADTVTVYRTLNTLTGKKLVHRVRGEDRSWHYAFGKSGDKPAHQHPHFVCDECGTMECLETSIVPASVAKSIPVKKNYEVDYPELVLHGKCPKCH